MPSDKSLDEWFAIEDTVPVTAPVTAPMNVVPVTVPVVVIAEPNVIALAFDDVIDLPALTIMSPLNSIWPDAVVNVISAELVAVKLTPAADCTVDWPVPVVFTVRPWSTSACTRIVPESDWRTFCPSMYSDPSDRYKSLHFAEVPPRSKPVVPFEFTIGIKPVAVNLATWVPAAVNKISSESEDASTFTVVSLSASFNVSVDKVSTDALVAISVPPAVEPSWMWIELFDVLTVISPAKPVKEPCWALVPLLNWIA